jgi:hypothetical protein
VKLKRLLLVAALVIAATPSLASEDFIPNVSLEAGAIGDVAARPWSADEVPTNKPPVPGNEDGNDIYFIASSPDSQAIGEMLSWRWRFMGRFQVRRA